jgi:3-deoxy-manno-octulosonate cytidylyltransferase (CMP-KDO synthetase)
MRRRSIARSNQLLYGDSRSGCVMGERVLAVIPARFGSTRLPGKPLARIAGKPMVQHVYERVRQVQRVDRVCVATDDDRIARAVESFGGEVVKTSLEHRCGTDRVAEVARGSDATLVLNVQGDMPFVEPATMDAVLALLLADPSLPMATAKVPIFDRIAWENPHVVKVVTDRRGQALYFSRSPIPFWRAGEPSGPWGFKHLGIYGFRREFLLEFAALPTTDLERAESLEQLRALEHGYRIGVAEVQEGVGIEIDTPEDLERAEEVLRADGPQ